MKGMPPVSGRGATDNSASSRFNSHTKIWDGDWLDDREAVDGQVPKLRTEVRIELPKSILARNTSPDIPFDRSVNPYRGCEHGCIYCYARPTHAYHDLSPGLDFETKLFAKPNAASLLQQEISKQSYAPAPIAFGTNTDPYQPIEGHYGIMRECLEVLSEANHPLTITTKSNRILRDLDILAPMAAKGLVAVSVSVTTLDSKLHQKLEPRAPHPEKRLEALTRLSEAGIPTHLSASPMIPAINDHELEAIVKRAADSGARAARYILVRLPHEVAPLFQAWLVEHFPDRADKVMAQIRAMRGGKSNDPQFHSRMRGKGVWADLISARFARICRKYGLNQAKMNLRTDMFQPPERSGQMRLL